MSDLTDTLAQPAYLTDVQVGIANLGRKNRNIFVYYGEPWLTSRLSRALHDQLFEQGQLCAFVDGAGLRENTASPLERGPMLLRRALAKGEIDFSCMCCG